jgi:hypothetical protein
MHLSAFFSPNYQTAKERFIAAVTLMGFRHESLDIGTKGPAGEALTIDTAFLGSPQPARLVIVSSGLHGVEGFFGSAVMQAWLEQRAKRLAIQNDMALVLIHALNPFGFAWRRRCNENNVDLNRNFIVDRVFPRNDPNYVESIQVYEKLSAFLNPATAPSRFEPYTLKAIRIALSHGDDVRTRIGADKRPSSVALKSILDLGIEDLEKAITVGQYEHAGGLFFGGTEPQQTTNYLKGNLPVWAGSADTIIHIDLHTGLGAYGKYKLLLVDEAGSEPAQWVSNHFGHEHVEPWDGRTPYQQRGLMAAYFKQRFAGRHYHGLTAEFGTYSPIRVLGALRAEQRAHLYAAPTSSAYEWAKHEVMEAFCPSPNGWRNSVVNQGLSIIEKALNICAEKPALKKC